MVSISRRKLIKNTVVATAAYAAGESAASAYNSENGTSKKNKNTPWENIMFESATVQAQLIRDKKLSSEELVAAHLKRIDQINPKINAVVALAGNALEQARLADKALASGNLLGPLHGVPMTIKDCFDTEGVVSTWGTMGRKNFVPEKDATVVKRLKEAGAILLGKTNTPEFTLSFETHNNIYGFTNNPHDLTRSPGGSSGGAAAAIAAGLIPFDIGTDYGGSVRVPSHCCGIVGIKPTSGSVPRTGLCLPPGMLTDPLSHVGPLARRVEDLRLLLGIIWGPDAIDTRISDVAYPGSLKSGLKGLKCAVMTDNGSISPDSETIAAVEMAGKILEDSGLNVKNHQLTGLAQTPFVDNGFWAVGAHAAIKQSLDDAGTNPDQYANNWFRQMTKTASDQISGKALNKQLLRFEQYRSKLQQQMSQFDVLISPVNARPAQLHPAAGDAPFPIEYASYTMAYDLTGWPSGVVRGGTSPEGLPIGVQITANPWREDIVLAVMSQLENVFPKFDPPVL